MSITFSAVCSLLQSIENVTTQQPRQPPIQEKENVRQIVTNWFLNQRTALDDPSTNGGAVLSALFPHRRKDRVYGLKAPLLAKKIALLLSFGHGQKALFDGWPSGKIGDLGAYTERAMKPWDGTFGSKRDLPINQIDQLLVQLAAKYRFSNEAIRKQRNCEMDTDKALKEILVRLESWEAKWLVRLILRNHATIELDERHVLSTYHFLLPDLLLFQDDFDVVFDLLHKELSDFPAVSEPTQEKKLRSEAAQRLKPAIGVKVGRPTFYKAWSFKHCFQMVGERTWLAETKYDGEYCEIHVDLANTNHEIKIFSKNGKDATADRALLLPAIRKALRIGQPECLVKSKCIVVGEMVLYSDREKRILPFHKIRKHVSRSGSFLGTWKDSLPHAWEHLMIVFFDVLLLDHEPVLRHCLQDRRKILRDLVQVIPGRSMRSEWTLLDFRTGDGMTDFKQVFARSLANRQEGLILKPLSAPYFPLLTDQAHGQAGYFIKVKKDYLGDMGGERDLGDFAVIGAGFDAQLAPKSDIKPLHWTHFYLGCCTNTASVHREGCKPCFKVVAILSIDACIPKPDAKYLNSQGYLLQVALPQNSAPSVFDIEYSNGIGPHMTIAFRKPFVAEVLGGGYDKLPNEEFEMLRHPRVKKIHSDRAWEDCVSLDGLIRMAEEKWEVPNAEKLDGHARDVVVLMKKYVKASSGSQSTTSTCDTTQEITQQTTQRSEELTPLKLATAEPRAPNDAVVQDTKQDSYTTTTSSVSSVIRGKYNKATKLKRKSPILVREDTSERLDDNVLPIPPTPTPDVAHELPLGDIINTTPSKSRKRALSSLEQTSLPQSISILPIPASTLPPSSSAPEPRTTTSHKIGALPRIRSFTVEISPPTPKRRKILTPLHNASGSQNVGSFDFDSQDGVLHIYAKEGLSVQVHTRRDGDASEG